MIDVTTTDDAVSYEVRDHNWRTKESFKSAQQVEAWFRNRKVYEKVEEVVIIQPDDRTAFKTVFELMLRLKESEMKWVTVDGKVDGQRLAVTWLRNEMKVHKYLDQPGSETPRK